MSFLPWTVRRVPPFLAGLLTLAAIAWAADLYRAVGLILFNEQLIAAILALALALVYLREPVSKKPGGHLSWYNALAAVIGFMAAGYVAVRYETLINDLPYNPVDGMIAGGILLVLVLEGLRRVAGNTLLFIVLAFIGYALFGHLVPGQLQGRPVEVRDLFLYLALDPHGLLGPVVGIACTIVIAFIFLGTLLFRSGGSGFFTDVSLALMGGFRGGSAKIAVTASALFGSISGSAVANVASTGVITIPMMKQAGYRSHDAGAIEAVASTGGQLMPPIMGASAFLMAEFLEIPYTDVVIAALIPALLYYTALFIQVDLQAARQGITPVNKEEITPVRDVFAAGWYFPLPIAIVIGGLFWLNLPPETAALYAAIVIGACGLLSGYRGKRMTFREAVGAFSATGFAVLEIIMIAAAASFIIGILHLTGLGFALTLALVKLGADNLILLLVLAAGISIILGMGMPTVGVYVLLAALVAPSLVEVGVVPIAAHLFVLYFGLLSMTTPPVALAAYAGASIAQADTMKTALSAIRFGWPAYIVPFLFVASPTLLLQGEIAGTLLTVGTAVAGVWLVTVGVTGYFKRFLEPSTRIGFCTAGLALLLPARAFEGAGWTDLLGIVLGALLVAREVDAVRGVRSAFLAMKRRKFT